KLLRHGLLVEDGEQHACLRSLMEPVMSKQQVLKHLPAMVRLTDQVLDRWQDDSVLDMLVEMRRAALLIFMGTLLDVDFEPDLERMWDPILRSIKYISPGLWILWPDIPRPGYKNHLERLDDYLYALIRDRRSDPRGDDDLLGRLVRVPEMSDELIRDQLLTMLIAGHDTSTALLAWALHLLSQNRDMMAKAQSEVTDVLGYQPLDESRLDQLPFLDMVIKETLRLYPPIHVGNRIVVKDTNIAGYELAAGTRTMVSIYLSHRDERYWPEPEQFKPERFRRDAPRPPAFTYLPFGAGPRSCIGALFAQVESKAVLSRILQRFTLSDTGQKVRPHMGATLEPHPGVFLRVSRRKGRSQ
ncbi:MAG: cytochrome P450, partial [Candidatus Promineifilaceae bacterium]